MKRSIFLFCFFIALGTEPLHAQAGSTGLAFLKLGSGARALGMGEAYTALAADPSATYYNPSALSFVRNPQLLLMHREWIQDTRTDYLAGTTNIGNFSAGISVNGTTVSDIEIRSVPGPAQGTFTARFAAIGLSGAYAIDTSISVGLTVKYLYEKILADEAAGYGLDLGATYLSPWNIRFGISLNNLGSMSELENEATKLPESFRLGAAYIHPLESLDGTLTFAADFLSYTDESISHLLMGLEFDYHHTFAARLGYQTAYDSKGFSAGIGVRYGIVTMDYAFVPFKYELGSTHTLSVLLDFQ